MLVTQNTMILDTFKQKKKGKLNVKKLISLKHGITSQITHLKLQKSSCDLVPEVSLLT